MNSIEKKAFYVALIAVIAVVGGVLFFKSGKTVKGEYTSFSGPTMGTHFRVVIAGRWLGEKKSDELLAAVQKRVDELNGQMSIFSKTSCVSRFNAFASPDVVFKVTDDVFELVRQSKRIWELSGGSFDITVGPLVKLWGFGKKKIKVSPDPERVKEVLATVGCDKLHIQSPDGLKKSVAGLEIDLGAVAQGYAADKVSVLLEQLGYENFMVDVGGEIVFRGLNPDGKRWTVGVETPVLGGTGQLEVSCVLPVSDAAVGTSGDYRNFFVDENNHVRYAHCIDPVSGNPVVGALASVTIIAPDGVLADAFATSAMVKGRDEGFEWIDSLPDVEGVFISRLDNGTFKVEATSGVELLSVKR